MRKIIYKIVFSFFIIIFIMSCADIINSDNTLVVVPKGEQPGLLKWLEYRFANDVLSFVNNDTTALWTVNKTEYWSKNFYIVNVSQDTILNITSIKLMDGKYFIVAPVNSIPMKLSPFQTNTSNLVFISIDTKNLKQGVYSDKIIINDNPNIGFFIRVNVF